MIEYRDREVYLEYFHGREDFFGFQCPDYYKPIPRALDNDNVGIHLIGNATFGIYVLTKESKCWFICFDIDIPKNDLDGIDFTNQLVKLNFLNTKINNLRNTIKDTLKIDDNYILLEDTGGRGYHIWVFFETPITGLDAQKLNIIIKSKINNFDYEFFPKQIDLNEKRKFGNLIKLPLGVHRKYQARSLFFKINNDDYEPANNFAENMMLLSNTKKVPSKHIIEAVSSFQESIKIEALKPDHLQSQPRLMYNNDFDFLFEHCLALKSLKAKATNNIKFSYNEAFHLANILLSVEGGKDCVVELLKKSYTASFMPHKTEKEIAGIIDFYPTSCKTLINKGLCSGYCNEVIREKNEDNLLPDTTPLSAYLNPLKSNSQELDDEEIIEQICDINNFRSAYWKLKKYHRDEDALFYDGFDFEFFEQNLDYNLEFISELLKSRIDKEYPFIKYDLVNIPKKLNEKMEMQYRPMAYSTIHDQVVIQAIFNIIAPLIEVEFSESSYGYRISDEISGDHLFKDWREAYPRFRHNLVANLRNPENKYYICCDIEKYYDNVHHDILIEQVRKALKGSRILPIVEHLIKHYEINLQAGKGLPQGPGYARVLANLYLHDFDVMAKKLTNGYSRYVDDVFLFFESKEAAEKGLEAIMDFLNHLGLKLSFDEEKKPQILLTSDDKVILDKIDSLQYGLFEEFRFINHFNENQISSFYNAVQKNKIDKDSLAELIKINGDIPAILYLISKKSHLTHNIKKQFIGIINYLVKNGYFHPKRIKTIFHYITDLLLEYQFDIRSFFSCLDNTHKIYMLLTLNEKAKNNEFDKELLFTLASDAASISNIFLQGFAIQIGYNLKGTLNFSDFNALIDKSTFLKTKVLNCLRYDELTESQKQLIRNNITENSNYLEKKYLLSSIGANFEHIDEAYLIRLISVNSVDTLLECCKIFTSLKRKTHLFDGLVEFLTNQFDFKYIVVNYVCYLAFNKYKNCSNIELNGTIDLYKLIDDDQLKRELINTINRISQNSVEQDEFSRDHLLINSYNQCLYLESKKKDQYDFLEKIPQSQLAHYGYKKPSTIINKLNSVAYSRILPISRIDLDSSSNDLLIEYKIKGIFEPFDLSFLKKDKLLILDIMVDLYKKANFFYKEIQRVPYITTDNIAIDNHSRSIVFRTFGTMLCPLKLIKSEEYRFHDRDEIPKFIALTLRTIFCDNDDKAFEDFKKNAKGLDLLIILLIEKLASKDPVYRYSYDRFAYIVNRIKSCKDNAEYYRLYFEERLYSLIFKNCFQQTNWYNINEALKDFYETLSVGYPFLESKENTDIKSIDEKLFSSFHVLSRSLISIMQNLKEVLGSNYKEDNVTKLFLVLNYYAIVTIETVSLLKVGFLNRSEIIIEPDSTSSISIHFGEREYKYSSVDANKIIELIHITKSTPKVFDSFLNYSLKQMAAAFILNCFKVEGGKGQYSVIKYNFKDEDAKEFGELLLKRLGEIEDEIAKLISYVIRNFKISNKDILQYIDMGLEQKMHNYCVGIGRFHGPLGVKRHHGKICDIKGLPSTICCKTRFGKKVVIDFESLYKVPLNNNYPTAKGPCSWDTYKGQPFNLVIPNYRITRLLSLIKKDGWFRRIIKFYLSPYGIIVDGAFVIIALLVLLWMEDKVQSRVVSGSLVTLVLVRLYYRFESRLKDFVSSLFSDKTNKTVSR